MKRTLLGVGMIALITAPNLVSADTNNSLSGSLSIGAIVIDSGNNLNPEGSDKKLDNLDSAADRKNTVMPGILPEVTWDAGEPEGVKFYLTTDPPIDEVGGFSFNLGASYGLGQTGIIDTAVFFTPFEKAYKNPYITGVDREETDTNKYGLRVGLNRIMDTGFRAQFVYLNDSIEDDVIGELFPELARDGSIYSLNLNYSHYVGEKLELRPRMSIRVGDYEGDANSFVKYKIDFEARYITGQWRIVPRVYFSHSDYIETSPIFDKTRDNTGYGVSLLTTYKAPFEMDNWSVTCLVDMSKGDSNIDFYDTESMTVGALFSYHF
ncbi:DUF2860 family protein [Desulfopila sp. IMCC35008]|uniref:DUF2860 family protein n=1 Tax=Desulfopila sp. IMCC35008 TaxID=2653858 RepID=UPI0013CF92D4|nr:DUF2860 family protein [Desulfopila sp. IMCC35008]